MMCVLPLCPRLRPELLSSSLSAMAATLLVIALLAGQPCQAGEIDYSRDIRPILSDNCFQCHGPDEGSREADLRLDLKADLFRQQDGHAIVAAGKPDGSELFRRIAADDADERMPPSDSNLSLSATEIATIKAWIEQGAVYKQHWAFEPPVAPTPPPVAATVVLLEKQQATMPAPASDASVPAAELIDWGQDPLDQFILRRLAEEGRTPSRPADKARLLRRVSLDLTGLPPTPAEVKAFLDDASPEAYEQVVDRLLASPRFGERMAWEWLDAARYADSNGFQGDPERTMWPWRDWVVAALNNNMPFDQFTIEQLAGDLLPEPTLAQQIATGFNRNHMHNGEGGRIAEETRIENVFDRAETTATVWLGATFTCARCHDHKFDPFSQREYYELFAFFNNTSETGSGRSGQLAPALPAPTAEQTQQTDQLREQIARLDKELQKAEKQLDLSPQPPSVDEPPEPPSARQREAIATLRKKPAGRTTVELKTLAAVIQSQAPQTAALLRELEDAKTAQDALQKAIPQVMVMDDLPQPRKTFMLVRGAYDKPGEAVQTGTPAIFPPLPPSESGKPANRLTLARWLVSPEHPLTARVIVNRYWQQYFGVGLVKTTEDFGVQGEQPSHPQLLDYLATEFVASGWNVKAMHKRLVMSATYRQTARATAEQRELDPDNRLLGRGPRFRMPSWMIRDQALAVSGLLVEQQGGSSVKPYQPNGVWAEATFGKKKYVQEHGDALYRRSLYTFWRRIVGPVMFFDAAKRQTCSVNASRTNTPLHALAVLNDTTFVEAARAMAQRVMEGREDPSERVAAAFRLAVAREPSDRERQILTDRYLSLRSHYADDPEAALELLQVGESPRNEALEATDHAAFLGVCLVLLNLDETLNK
ncbi:PSD1 and planctomycete cytochrome C domain-containing protein [Lignipirellula cremea]|uniref:PSD1 and planctomycete cytochrome C domain-containing protein n=1 Tax=Lignipirellula cremea TaxID=2528010 RepID=UPI001E3BD582|nr:PSD1 and planctomycete cytochrome C domain-containing protein [Lignipirellula cremea]